MKNGQSGGASRWRVCYQRVLTRLVSPTKLLWVMLYVPYNIINNSESNFIISSILLYLKDQVLSILARNAVLFHICQTGSILLIKGKANCPVPYASISVIFAQKNIFVIF